VVKPFESRWLEWRPPILTDRTDETSPERVLSVLSVQYENEPDSEHGDEILETRGDIEAVRIWSALLGRELWLARDGEVASKIPPGLPVLLFEEVPRLRAKSPAVLRALLDIRAEFPGSRWLQ